jgi:hypothetical protein
MHHYCGTHRAGLPFRDVAFDILSTFIDEQARRSRGLARQAG